MKNTIEDNIYGIAMNNSYRRMEIIDCGGNPVKKTKDEYPYSYDLFLQWVKSGIYIKSEKGCHAVYSDRLFQWDNKKYDRCCKEVWNNQGQYFNCREASDIEKFLRLYYDDPKLELVKIGEGCNVSTGYPYWVFWYKSGN
jgi:hypothetical protein